LSGPAPTKGILRLCLGMEGIEPTYDQDSGEWRLSSRCGDLELSAPVIILANSWGASSLGAAGGIIQKRVRGQVTHLPEGDLPGLRCVLTREGYVIPGVEGLVSLGATYDFGFEQCELSSDSHRENVNRLTGLVQVTPSELNRWEVSELGGRVGFRALTPDRFPVVGPLSRMGQKSGGCRNQPGMFALLGLGSRGIVWSGMMGELIGAQIEGEPLCLESDLVGAVDPSRFFGRPGLSGGRE